MSRLVPLLFTVATALRVAITATAPWLQLDHRAAHPIKQDSPPSVFEWSAR